MFRLLIVFLIIVMTFPTQADDRLIENFSSHPEMRWKFIADTVMGGISSGELKFNSERGETYARMTGNVSTENNGGFIQFRMKISNPLPEKARGLRVVVRGNDQRYFIHLRTRGTFLPWQYYQLGFEVSKKWTEVLLPFKDFKASSALLKKTPYPEGLRSIGVVAFGRDHKAAVEVLEVSYF